jgi:hypothetical protein
MNKSLQCVLMCNMDMSSKNQKCKLYCKVLEHSRERIFMVRALKGRK